MITLPETEEELQIKAKLNRPLGPPPDNRVYADTILPQLVKYFTNPYEARQKDGHYLVEIRNGSVVDCYRINPKPPEPVALAVVEPVKPKWWQRIKNFFTRGQL